MLCSLLNPSKPLRILYSAENLRRVLRLISLQNGYGFAEAAKTLCFRLVIPR
jgi:hypothetical protein